MFTPQLCDRAGASCSPSRARLRTLVRHASGSPRTWGTSGPLAVSSNSSTGHTARSAAFGRLRIASLRQWETCLVGSFGAAVGSFAALGRQTSPRSAQWGSWQIWGFTNAVGSLGGLAAGLASPCFALVALVFVGFHNQGGADVHHDLVGAFGYLVAAAVLPDGAYARAFGVAHAA